MIVRILERRDAEAWWALRLEALESEPYAFGTAADDHRRTSPADAPFVTGRSAGNFFLGAFAEDRLAGSVRFLREPGLKERHKGHVYGMYVSLGRRGRGVGRALLTALLDRVASDPSLETVLLGVTSGQTAARALYRSVGFVPYGLEPGALKIGSAYVDEELLALRLPWRETAAPPQTS